MALSYAPKLRRPLPTTMNEISLQRLARTCGGPISLCLRKWIWNNLSECWNKSELTIPILHFLDLVMTVSAVFVYSKLSYEPTTRHSSFSTMVQTPTHISAWHGVANFVDDLLESLTSNCCSPTIQSTLRRFDCSRSRFLGWICDNLRKKGPVFPPSLSFAEDDPSGHFVNASAFAIISPPTAPPLVDFWTCVGLLSVIPNRFMCRHASAETISKAKSLGSLLSRGGCQSLQGGFAHLPRPFLTGLCPEYNFQRWARLVATRRGTGETIYTWYSRSRGINCRGRGNRIWSRNRHPVQRTDVVHNQLEINATDATKAAFRIHWTSWTCDCKGRTSRKRPLNRKRKMTRHQTRKVFRMYLNKWRGQWSLVEYPQNSHSGYGY